MEPPKKPKKRGRKPKNNIIINENPVFNTAIEDLVIQLKHNKSDIVSEELPGYEYKDVVVENITTELCWNCCHKLDTISSIGLPLKYSDGIFYTYGTFCSFECASRYIFDNFNNKELWDVYSLLNLFYNISNDTVGEQVRVPPNRLVLKSFGGTLDIQEYRQCKDNYDIKIPPIISISHTINKHTAKIKTNDNKSELKLYRKSSLTTKNNIFSKMNINNEKQN